MTGDTSARKLEHLKMIVSSKVESRESTLLEYVRIAHNPTPEVNLGDVSLEIDFCGGRLRAPLVITGMTGGHPDVEWINRELASVAEELGIAIGVGSQRAAIEDPSLARTFRAAREAAPNAFLIANLGAPQLSLGYSVREVRMAVEMIDADAIAIHLNPGQEAYQPEGDPFYRGVVGKIAEAAEAAGVPVIVKETGNGLSREAVAQLRALGVRCFDVAGLGGTNWIKIEVLRGRKAGSPLEAGPLQDFWGNPTAIALMEARAAAPDAYIIASGGVRNGLDAARAIALGADAAGVALPAIRSLLSGGREATLKLLKAIEYQLRTAVYMVGETRVRGLWRAPIVVWGRLAEEAEARGVDPRWYTNTLRLEALVYKDVK
ncbi:isopentenyl-diphosphate delta-isomerase [Aeropyrum pernix]|uniref:Isopentenyl-diphosphate delta-isomerase n=1 Tax=Aeropyrum pernix TaxID=56636 RepID=A0A401H8G4_AERPX|nr:type 2 isopentenyl-diphosphate Delta-isomerase [Aeropyrum pernix]GBF08694.1 isopentenyl-diphosphate delta-isomerase [Aeropyrum pernix]